MMGQLIGSLIQIVIGQSLTGEFNGDRLGRSRRLLFKQLLNAAFARILDRRVIPFDEELLPLGFLQQV